MFRPWPPQVSIKIATRHRVADLPHDTMARLQLAFERAAAVVAAPSAGCAAGPYLALPHARAPGARLTLTPWHVRNQIVRTCRGLVAPPSPSSAPGAAPLITGMAVRPGCVRIVLETSRAPPPRQRRARRRVAPASAAPAPPPAAPRRVALDWEEAGASGGSGDLRALRQVEEGDEGDDDEGPVEEDNGDDGDEEEDAEEEEEEEDEDRPLTSKELSVVALGMVESLGLDAAHLSHMDHVDVQVRLLLLTLTTKRQAGHAPREVVRSPVL